jgi:hypothetical protein
LLAPVVYLADPSRVAAGGLLPHPFTHHLCPGAVPRSHRLVYSLLHLTWRRACAQPPLGFLARAAFRAIPGEEPGLGPCESGLSSTFGESPNAATGRTVQLPLLYLTKLRSSES